MQGQITCRVPQGSNLGPLLFLIYINDLPNCLKKAASRMYDDDTNITLAASDLNVLEWQVNKLSLNIAKTEFMLIGSRQRLLLQCNQQIQIQIQIEGKNISQVEKAKSLVVFIDDKLTWKNHVDEISKRISSGIGALKRLRPFVSLDTAKKIYDSLVQPHFDYCCTVWDGINNKLTEKLQKLQNRTARVITKSSYEVSSSPLLDALGWEKLISNRQKHKASMVFKSLHNLTPVYLHNMFCNFNTHYGI